MHGWTLLLAAVLLGCARPHPFFAGSIRKAGLKSFVGHPLRPRLHLSLRGGGPKASSVNRSYPPGSLPDWAEDIVKYRNSTPFSERATEARNFVWDSTTTSSSDDGAAPHIGLRWEGVDKGFVKRDANMEEEDDDEEDMDPGWCPLLTSRGCCTRILTCLRPAWFLLRSYFTVLLQRSCEASISLDCMCVCVYACMYMSVYVCMYVCMYVHVYECFYVFL